MLLVSCYQCRFNAAAFFAPVNLKSKFYRKKLMSVVGRSIKANLGEMFFGVCSWDYVLSLRLLSSLRDFQLLLFEYKCGVIPTRRWAPTNRGYFEEYIRSKALR